MEEIEVGEYVRTKKGSIGKFKFNDVDNIIVYFKNQYGTTCVDKTEIVNHNKIISEIVEVGDYVNGEHIDYITNKGVLLIRDNINFFDKYKGISNIVTHEQFKSVEYEVK